MYQTIIVLLVIVLLINHFHNYNVNHKLREEIKAMRIPFDDYSRYQKAYVEFYKWLLTESSDKLGYSRSTFHLVYRKYNEYFTKINTKQAHREHKEEMEGNQSQ